MHFLSFDMPTARREFHAVQHLGGSWNRCTEINLHVLQLYEPYSLVTEDLGQDEVKMNSMAEAYASISRL